MGETKPHSHFEKSKSRVTFTLRNLDKKPSEDAIQLPTNDLKKHPSYDNRKECRSEVSIPFEKKSLDENNTNNTNNNNGNEFFLKNFDNMHSFKNYFTYNNAENVIKVLKLNRAKQKLKAQRRTLFINKRGLSRKSNDSPKHSPVNGLIFFKSSDVGDNLEFLKAK